VAQETGNDKGFWLQGNASTNYSATITVQLTNVPDKFNWCAYVSDYPPNAKITTGTYNNGTYTLKGTKPFTINGAVVDANTYSGGGITSITDATQCPGYRCSLRDEAVGTIGCCSGLVNINGYCRDLVADAASTYTCNGVVLEVKNTPGAGTTWSNANTTCNNLGWKLPSYQEAVCLFDAGRLIKTACYNGVLWGSWDWWLDDCNCCRTGVCSGNVLCNAGAACNTGGCANNYPFVCVRN
jgi:hypothetical protein